MRARWESSAIVSTKDSGLRARAAISAASFSIGTASASVGRVRSLAFSVLLTLLGVVTPAAAGQGPASNEEDELPQLPPTMPEAAPRGAQDGLVAGAVTGAARGLVEASVYAPTTTPSSPAQHYAGLDRGSCEAELLRRKISFERVSDARGVIAPVRLTGRLGSEEARVSFHSMIPEAQRKTSPYEIYDCRLVLALDDWARILAKHDITEVIHYSVYRPPPAKQMVHGAGRRHSGALAIDAAIFKTKEGKTIGVEKDFHGRIGAKTCGVPTTGLSSDAVTLRQLVCSAADAQLFNVLLTPDYNYPHRNHFHLEVAAGVRWVMVH